MPDDRLFIIDGNGPFFDEDSSERTNWSKICFAELESNGKVRKHKRREVLERFREFVILAKHIGYNAVSIDDLAHLAKFKFYNKPLRKKIVSYRRLYRALIAICNEHDMKVFLTTDIMFYIEEIDSTLAGTRGRKRHAETLRLLKKSLKGAFKYAPDIEGVIFRLGESDGVDVEGDFLSRLTIRTASEGNRYLQYLLSWFRKHNKTMVVRTWTVGAYEIGDLIWNPRTYDRLFAGLEDPHFYVSMKYGDTDFFKYLDINPLIFRGKHQKILELQARREFEGFGVFPSFTGYDYESYYDSLSSQPTFKGIMVWCQTGGWCHFRHITFLANTSPWNEINTYTTVKIFREGLSAEEGIRRYCQDIRPELPVQDIVRLMHISDKVMSRLWYLPEFSRRRFYFRRVRIPPLLWIFWDTILINHTLRKILRRVVEHREEAIHEGYQTLELVKEMAACAARAGFDPQQFRFEYDTLEIVAIAREYFLTENHTKVLPTLTAKIEAYRRAYPDGFRIECDFSPWKIRRPLLKLLFFLLVRRKARYRIADRLVINTTTKMLFPILYHLHKRRLPELAESQAMGVKVLFK